MASNIDYSKIYSPYKLGMFAQCPKEYHFYYLDPNYCQLKNDLKKDPRNIWKFHTLGKAVHNAITLFYHLPPEKRTEKNLLESLKKTWQSEVYWDKEPPLGKWGGFETVEEERASYREALLMLKSFLKMAEIEPEIEYLPTHDFRHSIDDYKKLITPLNADFDLSGQFDLITREVEGALHIIDFKTGKSDRGDTFQLRFYKVLAEANFEKPVVKASFYFLGTGHKESFDLGGEEVEEIREEILEKIKEIKATRSFFARPGKLCKFCLFRDFCPEGEEVVGVTRDVSAEDYPEDLPF